jgi:hypothetical protein
MSPNACCSDSPHSYLTPTTLRPPDSVRKSSQSQRLSATRMAPARSAQISFRLPTMRGKALAPKGAPPGMAPRWRRRITTTSTRYRPRWLRRRRPRQRYPPGEIIEVPTASARRERSVHSAARHRKRRCIPGDPRCCRDLHLDVAVHDGGNREPLPRPGVRDDVAVSYLGSRDLFGSCCRIHGAVDALVMDVGALWSSRLAARRISRSLRWPDRG